MTRPECADDPDRWFSDRPDDIAAAKAACTNCPVRDACAVAGRDEPWGVWGGLTTGERLGLMLLATPEPATPQHGKRGTGCHCADCRAAHASYMAEWRARERHSAAGVTERETIEPEQLALLPAPE